MMLRKTQLLRLLVAILLAIHANYLPAQTKKEPVAKPRAVAPQAQITEVHVSASSEKGKSQKDKSQKDKADYDHCFGQDTSDDPRDLTFNVKTTGVSQGTLTVQVVNLSQTTHALTAGTKALDAGELQKYAEAMQVELKKDPAHANSASRIAKVIFKADAAALTGGPRGPDHKPFVHLGPGICDPNAVACPAQYTAYVSIVSTSQPKRKSGRDVLQIPYYYTTYKTSPDECSNAKTNAKQNATQ
jgi:hypothetical protein